MGAGVAPAGAGLAGYDPVVVPSDATSSGLEPVQFYASARGQTTPLALKYDPSVLGFVMNADGSFQGVHPIDQQVALAMFIPYGSISSAPTVGAKWNTVFSRVPSYKVQAVGLNELNRCLAALIAQNAIAILSFSVTQNAYGRYQPSLAYTNLLDPRYNPSNPAVAARTLSGTS